MCIDAYIYPGRADVEQTDDHDDAIEAVERVAPVPERTERADLQQSVAISGDQWHSVHEHAECGDIEEQPERGHQRQLNRLQW